MCLGLGACTTTDSGYQPVPHASDLIPVDQGKADGLTFDRDMLISDDLFRDAHFLSVEQVQAFLEETPYGTPSSLAYYDDSGRMAAETLVHAAIEYEINPLVLLVKLQVEFSLIYETAPAPFAIDHAMGCGCHDDNPSCSRGPGGFQSQIMCAATTFNAHFEKANRGEPTLTGWQVDREKESEDGFRVVPANAATAALYTYTPWVLPGTGGNWLFWNVLHKFSRYLLKQQPNHRWIGGVCETDTQCGYDGGVCRDNDENGGFCTRSCQLFCPDTEAPYSSTTFCVALDGHSEEMDAGWCVSRCDEGLYPDTEGCREGFQCIDVPRYGDSETVKRVCWPNAYSLPEPIH